MNYPFKTIFCIISSPCHLCNLEYDKVELTMIYMIASPAGSILKSI